jgi:pyridoxine kinase
MQVIVDLVIGDHDTGIYVADGMVEAVRELLLPLAHGLTPNDFELGHLRAVPPTASSRSSPPHAAC